MLQRNTSRKKNKTLLRSLTKKKATTVAVAFFLGLRCSAASQQIEEGDDAFFVELRYVAAQLHSKKKKVTAVAITFFFLVFLALHKKKGDGGCRRLLRGAALQRASELFMELHYNATSGCLWSCALARLRAVRGAALQCGSELFVELRCNVASSSAQL
jgi:hypothetical protein